MLSAAAGCPVSAAVALASVAVVVLVVAVGVVDDAADCNWIRKACNPDENCWSGLAESNALVVDAPVLLASLAWAKPLKKLPRAWPDDVLDDVVSVDVGGAEPLWMPQLGQY